MSGGYFGRFGGVNEQLGEVNVERCTECKQDMHRWLRPTVFEVLYLSRCAADQESELLAGEAGGDSPTADSCMVEDAAHGYLRVAVKGVRARQTKPLCGGSVVSFARAAITAPALPVTGGGGHVHRSVVDRGLTALLAWASRPFAFDLTRTS